MAELMNVIKGRRSVRHYLDKKVQDEALQKIFEAVRWAPSWANTQVWEIIVVKDAAMKEKVFQTLSPNNPAGKAVMQAPVLIILCTKLKSSGYYKGEVTTKFGDWFMFDAGIVAQVFCLAAYEENLGTVIVGLFDHDKAGKALAVPDGFEVVALIPLGYPAKVTAAPSRRESKEFVHYESF